MNLKAVGLAVVAGIAAFIVVGVGITEFTHPWIAFSLFLGLPAGIAAGGLTTAAVYLGLAEDAPAHRRRTATGFAGFGIAFLILLLALGGFLNLGATLSLGIALVLGLLAGIGVYLRGTSGS